MPCVVVAGPDNAATELVEDGVNGVVAPTASADDLGGAIARVHAEAGGSYKGAARLLRVPDSESKRFLNFLGHHDLGVEK